MAEHLGMSLSRLEAEMTESELRLWAALMKLRRSEVASE